MRTYVIEVEVYEGNKEFWKAIRVQNRTGCEKVVDIVSGALEDAGWDDCKISLKSFKDD